MPDDYGFDQVRMYPEIGQPTWVELIVARQDGLDRVGLHRELVDPADYPDVHGLTLALVPGASEITGVYLRRFGSAGLDPVPGTAQLRTGMSLVALIGVDPQRAASALASTSEIMPGRMVWPY